MIFKIYFEKGLNAELVGTLSEDVYLALYDKLLAGALDMGYEKVTESQIEEALVLPQLELFYMYRDGANWKESTSVIFTNPLAITSEKAEEMLREALYENDNFIAEAIDIPTCYFDEDKSKHAHGLHEFLSIKSTDGKPNDAKGRDISQFILEFARQSQKGWKPIRQII